MLDGIEAQILQADKRLAKEAVDNPAVRLLMTIPGISYTSACGLVAAIGPIERFPSPKKLTSYFGLNPKVNQSGKHCWLGSISKKGRSHARWLLVEGSERAGQRPGPLQAFYLRIRRKKGHNVAVVAVARKLACIIWHMLRTGEPYRFAPPLRTAEKLRKLELSAGLPRRKTGPKKGQASQGGRPAYEARRRCDQDIARVAQAQYEELLRHWKERPERSSPARKTKAGTRHKPTTDT
jgi:hypothetical protein